MAVRKIAMVVNLRQNKNQAAEHFGKWYPEVDTKVPLDLKGFCAHMTEHGKLADYQMVVLVVQQVVECMKELVLQGQPVKLEGLGTFGPSLESKKGGANSVQAAIDAGLDTLIEGVHMNFTVVATTEVTTVAVTTVVAKAAQTRTDGAASTMPSLLEHCRVATSVDEIN